MKHTGFIFYFTLLFVPVVMSGCIREKGEDCPLSAEYLIVRSYDADNNEITGTGAVQDVVLYVFDEQNLYLETIASPENERVRLNYTEPRITVVAWGNSKSGHQQMPAIQRGTPLDEAEVTLLSGDTRASSGYSQSPDDLFFGTADIQLGQATGRREVVHPVPVKRKVASMYVVVKGLREWAGTSGDDFSLEISVEYGSIDFQGRSMGRAAVYEPAVSFDADGNFVSRIFNTFPSGTSVVSVGIYQGTNLIYSTSTDADGKPFTLADGRLLNVLIDLTGGSARTSFTVTEWGKTDINQDF